MFRLALTLLFMFGVVIACNPTTTTTTNPQNPDLVTFTPEPSTLTTGFTMAMGNRTVTDPLTGSVCVFMLTAQSVTGTANLTFDVGGFLQLVRINVSGGTYTATLNSCPLNPASATGPPIGPVTITFSLDYFGAYETVNPTCISASALEFTSFNLTGATPIDDIVENSVRGTIHTSMDQLLADTMNGSPIPAGANPRCSTWIDLDTSILTPTP